MMAAVQPMLSGSISKTVNMPEAATVEDVEGIYYEGWKLGLKALAIYRDNCKVGQPLSVAKNRDVAKPKEKEESAPVPAEQPAPESHEHRPVRRRLPKTRSATVTRFDVAGAEGYMTASTYPDGGVGEVFLKLGKQGSTLAGVMDAFSMAISVGLQYGIPLESYVAKFTNLRFEPAGMTDDPDIRIATSMMDYIFRRLALDHLPYEQRAELGILSAAERAAELSGQDPATLGVEVDPVTLAQSFGTEKHSSSGTDRCFARPRPVRSGPVVGVHPGQRHGQRLVRQERRPALHRRADRVPAGPHRGRPALPHLRNEDAPGGQLLRLRRLRLHQRLQLKVSGIALDATSDTPRRAV